MALPDMDAADCRRGSVSMKVEPFTEPWGFLMVWPDTEPESEPSPTADPAVAAPLEPLGRHVMVQELAMPRRRQ